MARGDTSDFSGFARAVCQTPDEKANPHFRSQHVTLRGRHRELLPDFVGRFENLEEDFTHVATKIGSPHLKLPRLTPSLSREGRHYRDFYDDESAERVGERLRQDVELFGHSL